MLNKDKLTKGRSELLNQLNELIVAQSKIEQELVNIKEKVLMVKGAIQWITQAIDSVKD